MMNIRAPFWYFGGKSRVADLVWSALGDCQQYIEPFCGSAAVLLARPTTPKQETINDVNCFVANFWRAVKTDPAKVSEFAEWPNNECDLHARNKWLIAQTEFRDKLKSDPEYFDCKIAGWWVWGLNRWFGGGWCEREQKQKPTAHQHKKNTTNTLKLFEAIANRMRLTRVLCGDWERCLTRNEVAGSSVGVFLDPPYGGFEDLYGSNVTISRKVREKALELGTQKNIRVVLAGYEGEHTMPREWRCVAWKNTGGFDNHNASNNNRFRERLWMSPNCLAQLGLGV